MPNIFAKKSSVVAVVDILIGNIPTQTVLFDWSTLLYTVRVKRMTIGLTVSKGAMGSNSRAASELILVSSAARAPPHHARPQTVAVGPRQGGAG